MRLADDVRMRLKGMDPVERENAVRELREVIYEDAYETIANHDDALACPRCGSVSIVKEGHNPNGSRRWQCRDCRRTFSQVRDTLIGRSKLPVAKWMMYVECFVDCLPLRECAVRCEVSLRTAWLMRRRLLKCPERFLPRFAAGAGVSVQLDETYLREGFKGNHTKGKFVLPRPARRRGASLHRRGLGGEQICIVTGVSDSDTAFAILGGRRVISKQRAIEALDGRILRGAHVMADTAAAYPGSIGGIGRAIRTDGREGASHQPGQHAPLEPRRVPSRVQGREHQTLAVVSDVVPVAALVARESRRAHHPAGGRATVPGRDARLEPCHAAVYGVLGHGRINCKYTVHITDIKGKEERHGEHTDHDHAPRPRIEG